jgi:hypothetical protein
MSQDAARMTKMKKSTERKRKFGISNCRMDDNIKMDLKGTSYKMQTGFIWFKVGPSSWIL